MKTRKNKWCRVIVTGILALGIFSYLNARETKTN